MDKSKQYLKDSFDKFKIQFSAVKTRRARNGMYASIKQPVSWPMIFEVPGGFIKQ